MPWVDPARRRSIFIERIAEAVGEAADDLTFNQKRVHPRPAIRDDRIVENLDASNLRVDRHDRGMRRIGEDTWVVCLVTGGGGQPGRIHLVRKILRVVIPRTTDFREFNCPARTVHAPVSNFGLGRFALQEVSADPGDRGAQGAARLCNGTAGGHHRPRGVCAGAGGRCRRIAEADGHVFRIDAENLVGNLGEDGLVSLPVRVRAHFDDQLAVAGQARNRRLHPRHQLDAPGGIAERSRAVGGLFIEGSKPDADQPSVGLAPFLTRTNARHVDQLRGALERSAVVSAVQGFLRDRHIRHLPGAHEVAQSQLDRIDAGRLGQAIHHDLMAETGQWPGDAAERLAGRLVADNIDRTAAERTNVVAALHVADGKTTFDASGPGPRGIRAGVDDDVAFEAENAPIGVGVGDNLAMVVATIGVAHERLVTILNPSHGPPQLHRGPRNADGFALDIGLEPERCTHIGRDDAKAPLADAQYL